MDSIVKYAIENNKYEEFKEKIEYVAVDHILVGTISRIINMKGYKNDSIQKCVNYIDNNYPDWKNNRFVKENILDNNKIKEKFQELNIV
jgi:hypothetical protein